MVSLVVITPKGKSDCHHYYTDKIVVDKVVAVDVFVVVVIIVEIVVALSNR